MKGRSMSCNAHNHPPDCNCGWGGIFYEANGQWAAPDWSKAESHTNPNAKCPVCSAPVFFYKSPEGGSVFFDSLGPPWPKHPCTDPDQTPQRHSPDALEKKKAGWWPLLREIGPLATFPLPKGEGTLVVDIQGREILIKGNPKILKKTVPLWMKAVPGKRNVYDISTIKTKNGHFIEVTFRAFGIKALEHPEYARLFQESIRLFNSYSQVSQPDAT
jgi:hypothetical protein